MKKQAQKDTTPKKDEAPVDVDPVADFNQNYKNHLNDKTKSIWLCYDCHKFTCTKC